LGVVLEEIPWAGDERLVVVASVGKQAFGSIDVGDHGLRKFLGGSVPAGLECGHVLFEEDGSFTRRFFPSERPAQRAYQHTGEPSLWTDLLRVRSLHPHQVPYEIALTPVAEFMPLDTTGKDYLP
jgi:hypothetical protein